VSEPDNGALGEILTTFLDESLDALREADAHLVALEADHSDHEGLEAVFRVLHSIKGNAAVFGLDAIKHLAHAMEDQLDQVRSKVREVDQPLISAVLAGCDLLRKGLNGVRSGAELAKDDLDRVLAAFGPVVPVVQGVDPERWAHVLGQAQELAEDLAVLPGDSGQRMAVLLDQLRHISSGSEGGVGDAGNPEERLAAFLAEPVPEQMTEDQIDSLRDLVSQVEDGAEDDAARALVEEMHEGFDTFADSVGFDDLFRGWLLDRVERIADEGAWAWHREAAQQAATAGRSGHSDGKTMRVAEHHIDTFLAYVGELLVVGDMFSHIQRRLDGAASSELVESFRRANETFEGLSNDLQTSIMSIRLVAVEAILQRVPRLCVMWPPICTRTSMRSSKAKASVSTRVCSNCSMHR
jgi:two-component system chemotaxis sensor kinase CheA